MKVDGFTAEPGDQDDVGVTGSMSVDSYTQYNQGGIGVSITNGAYAQLVSIFTICCDTAIYQYRKYKLPMEVLDTLLFLELLLIPQ